ncbi:MAG: hypothetical protein FJW63_03360 [Actinobacteria bacterium]|nr:hypothetical protein [Actinomycetota bacterium]
MKRIMWRKMTSADLQRIKINTCIIFIIFLIIIIFLSFVLLTSCKLKDNPDEKLISSGSYNTADERSLYLFDYEKIKLESTSSIDVKIENCNLYLDIYEDLVILGEVKNVSKVNKTDIEITIDFYDKHGEKIISAVIPAYINYLRGGSRLPFYYYLTEREKYIDVSKIKIGVNFKDYYERFEGNPIVENESYYYKEDYLIIEGKVINIGEGKIRNLKLFCTFYNDKNQVVFIKKCYLSREEMISGGEQKFTLRVLLDEYLPGFTHYRFEVFFEDEIKTTV